MLESARLRIFSTMPHVTRMEPTESLCISKSTCSGNFPQIPYVTVCVPRARCNGSVGHLGSLSTGGEKGCPSFHLAVAPQAVPTQGSVLVSAVEYRQVNVEAGGELGPREETESGCAANRGYCGL